MADNSKIEWTHHTANPWWGCTRVHKGCDNCYAATLSNRWGKDLWDNNKRQYIKSTWGKFQKWNDAAKKAGEYHRVFVGSMMDIFEKSMPVYNADGTPMMLPIEPKSQSAQWETHDLRDHFFRSIVPKYPNLMFLLLTKRPSNINKYIPEEWKTNPPRNVMFGASVVDMASARNVAHHLNFVNGAKFISVEPLLEDVDLANTAFTYMDDSGTKSTVDWIIVGGESGIKKRPFDADWARRIRKYCEMTGTAFFMKQMDKVEPIPEDLMIRQFPEWHNINHNQ